MRGGEEHVEHAPKGVLDVRGGVSNRPNTKNGVFLVFNVRKG